jgi:peptidoglycan/LPS O-acetylase OafA/YrhL
VTRRRAQGREKSGGSRSVAGVPVDPGGERIPAYDLARTFAIVTVFLGHSIINHTSSRLAGQALSSLSPWLTMSLLGFISALLLANRNEESGAFLIKRFTRLYPSLLLCLAVVTVLQLILGTAVLNADTAVHFMGLSGIFSLISAPNHASVGRGLWFVTVILVMYALLPALRRLFRHRRGFLHLVVIVVLGLVAHRWLFADGLWNVFIAFCVGTYLAVSGRLQPLSRWPARWALPTAAGLLGIYALASLELIPIFIRGLLLPFYPVVFLPLFFWAAGWLPRWVMRAAAAFAVVSYEFYILHFYFINDSFRDLFGPSIGLAGRLVIGFAVTFVLATAVNVVSRLIRRHVDGYLLEEVPTPALATPPLATATTAPNVVIKGEPPA